MFYHDRQDGNDKAGEIMLRTGIIIMNPRVFQGFRPPKVKGHSFIAVLHKQVSSNVLN